jgi:transcriptional regulator with XRE-family HTH domain
MTLQEIFILNLKKFRRTRGISQMALADLCDTSGNYIGEIEMGRRIPSFEKIEKIAHALQIDPYLLFVESDKVHENQELQTKNYLEKLPRNVKKEISSHLIAGMQQHILESFDPEKY